MGTASRGSTFTNSIRAHGLASGELACVICPLGYGERSPYSLLYIPFELSLAPLGPERGECQRQHQVGGPKRRMGIGMLVDYTMIQCVYPVDPSPGERSMSNI